MPMTSLVLLAFQENFYTETNKIDYEKLYRTGDGHNTSESALLSTPFESESYQIEVIVPGAQTTSFSKTEIPQGPGIIFIKMKNNKQKKLPLVNNGIMLRI